MTQLTTIIKTGQVSRPEPVFVFPNTPEYRNLTHSKKLQYEKAMGWICALTNPAFALPRPLEAGK